MVYNSITWFIVSHYRYASIWVVRNSLRHWAIGQNPVDSKRVGEWVGKVGRLGRWRLLIVRFVVLLCCRGNLYVRVVSRCRPPMSGQWRCHHSGAHPVRCNGMELPLWTLKALLSLILNSDILLYEMSIFGGDSRCGVLLFEK